MKARLWAGPNQAHTSAGATGGGVSLVSDSDERQGQEAPDSEAATPLEWAEAALAESEARLRLALDAARMGIFDWDLITGRLAWSRPHEELWGYAPGEFDGTYGGFASRLHPEDAPGVAAEIDRCRQSREPFSREFRVVLPDGSIRWVVGRGEFVFAEGGAPVRMRGVAFETTLQRLAAEELRAESARSRRVIEAAPVPFALNDEQGNITYLNPAFVENFGYTREEIPTLECWWPLAYPDPDYRRWVASEWAARVDLAKKTGAPFAPLELKIRARDGSERTVLASATSLEDAFASEHLVVLVDITGRLKAEEANLSLVRQIQHAQKLESLGVLAGGIAHDFNNLLVAIVGNAELALLDTSPMSPARESIRAIQTAAQRAAELVRQMLAYSGRGRFVVAPINLNDLVVEMSHLLEVAVSKKVVLRFNLAGRLPTFEGDATQVRQIIMNLITNASEAIGERSGVVAVSTGSMHCDAAYLSSSNQTVILAQQGHTPSEGLYVFVEVADTGTGMTREVADKIFDPFFTTKFTGRGLGLSATLGIVRGHKGALKIYSEPGRGTTFKVLFPATEGSEDGIADSLKAEEPFGRIGTGKVILADDEETVRMTSQRMLSRFGFDVLVASDGREALELFRRQPDDIVLVLIDLTMPHMDGEQAFREMRRIRPDVKVILASGYNEQEATERFIGKGLAGFLQKPYSMDDLRTKVREALTPPNR